MKLIRKIVKQTEDNARFYTKDGHLTAYSFACGYIEEYYTHETRPYEVTIASPPFKTTRPVWEVSIHKDSSVLMVTASHLMADGLHVHETKYFDKIKDARKAVSALRRLIDGVSD